jgi:large subunit ribosomal protein L19e
MSIKLAKRAAAGILDRGVSSIRIANGSVEDAAKAITKEDVRALIKSGKIYALKEKPNLSLHGLELKRKRRKGRGRGPGRRKGTTRARQGLPYQKKVRAQRRLIKEMKAKNELDNAMFRKYYALVKGGTFPTKVSLINHIRSSGVQITEERAKELKSI